MSGGKRLFVTSLFGHQGVIKWIYFHKSTNEGTSYQFLSISNPYQNVQKQQLRNGEITSLGHSFY